MARMNLLASGRCAAGRAASARTSVLRAYTAPAPIAAPSAPSAERRKRVPPTTSRPMPTPASAPMMAATSLAGWRR